MLLVIIFYVIAGRILTWLRSHIFLQCCVCSFSEYGNFFEKSDLCYCFVILSLSLSPQEFELRVFLSLDRYALYLLSTFPTL
jgi:hypothetical protein